MAGVILHEGIGRGPLPTLEVLSIGSITPIRTSSDLLPYVPRFRKFFTDLPQTVSQMNLKAMKVPITEIECVTKTMVKVPGPTWYLKINEGIDTHHRSIMEKY